MNMKEKLIYKSKSFWLVISFFFIIYLGYGKDFFSFLLNVSLSSKFLESSWKILPHAAALVAWAAVAFPVFYKKSVEQIKLILRFSLFPFILLMGLPLLNDLGRAFIPFNYAIHNVFYSSAIIGDLSYLDGFYLALYLSALVPVMYFTYGKEIADEMMKWVWPISRFIISIIFLFMANTILDRAVLSVLGFLQFSTEKIPLAIELITDAALSAVFLYFMYQGFADKFRHLWFKILIGLILGVFLGDTLGENANLMEPIGEIFIRLIKMLVVPLILSSMTVGIASIHDPKKLGRVGAKTLFMYLATTAVSICIGLGMAYIVKPGTGITIDTEVSVFKVAEETPSMTSLLVSVVPENPAEALTSGNVLQIIVFSLFLGLSIIMIGERGRPLLRVMGALSETMYKMTNIVMEAAPYGVCAIMAGVTGKYGLETVIRLMSFLASNYVCFFIQIIFVFGFILRFLAKLNFVSFLKGMRDAMAVAFSTNSSSGTLPVSLHCIQENLGVSRNIANFVLPLGSTVNMNGAAIGQAIAAVFVSQVYGIDLSWQSLAVIVVTATLSAIGAAGIPSSGIVMLSVVLSSVGLPTGAVIGMLYGVDRIREMGSTVVNILGDSVVAVYVAKTENELDIDQYNCAEYVQIDDSEI
ncbi:MAG: dicarboxylate/amino acid:cation symporter [Chlamydiales bacterium]|nr:dicarboxylate/amino acid:cation symporter [Chlamydiales bacterium]